VALFVFRSLAWDAPNSVHQINLRPLHSGNLAPTLPGKKEELESVTEWVAFRLHRQEESTHFLII
jgi:hypothetical protein